MSTQLLLAIPITVLFAALAYALGMVSRGGAVGGVVVGTLIYACLGPQGFAILALFVAGGSTLTRMGYGRKQRSRLAQESGGRRGARNAIANCSVAVLCAILASITGNAAFAAAFAAAFVASLGAAFADTAESEVGQLSGRWPRLVTTLRRVQPGTDGAVSFPGTLAGVGGAALTAALGLALGLVGGGGVAVLVALAAFLGTVADSLVGAVFPRLGNEVTNVICTLTAALTVILLA
ncbi:MAG: DUF92 domain-containing protein [Rubrobacteraceae bacterium]